MHKIDITINNQIINFSFGPLKFITGSNIELKYEVIRTLRRHFFGIDSTEYAIENGLVCEMKIDDKPLDTKRWKFYEIQSRFDFDYDLKLGSKSISLKYLESVLVNIEYEPLIQTINNLFKDLEIMIEDMLNVIESEIEIKAILPEMSLKTILKLIELNLYKDDSKMNMYDVSITNLIELQTKIVKKIAEMNPHNEYIICIETLELSNQLMKVVEDHRIPNLNFLIITEDKINTNVNNVVNFSSKIIDFANEVDLYNEIIMEAEFQMSMDLLKEYLSAYLKKDEVFGQKITKYL
ncbi:MAG: hypothetical protein RBT45_01875 [Acholeplasmataceae bacterium]|jgi:hypothetical protein|nr:hypothetical protein [Acholeplasmataceae bacterium]